MTRMQTETKTHTRTQIPTREEFHRLWAGEITIADFNTSHPNPYRLSTQFSAHIFNERMKR